MLRVRVGIVQEKLVYHDPGAFGVPIFEPARPMRGFLGVEAEVSTVKDGPSLTAFG